MEKLPPGEFEQIHPGYIVPVSKIQEAKSKKIILFSRIELPVIRSYSHLIKQFKNRGTL
jgi:DNA-binding LytR/AlgR family response regulator